MTYLKDFIEDFSQSFDRFLAVLQTEHTAVKGRQICSTYNLRSYSWTNYCRKNLNIKPEPRLELQTFILCRPGLVGVGRVLEETTEQRS